MIGTELQAQDGPQFVRETALANGQVDIAASARDSSIVLGVAADIADVMVTTARRAASPARIRMADAVQQLWSDTIDVEEPDLPKALAAATVTVGAVLWSATLSSAGSPTLHSLLVAFNESVDTPGRQTPSASARALTLGNRLARSFGWRSDVELSRSTKFRGAITSPGLVDALRSVEVPDVGIEAVEAVALTLQEATFEQVQDRFGPERVMSNRAHHVPEFDIEPPPSLIREPGHLEITDLTSDVPEAEATPVAQSGSSDQRVTVYFGTDRAESTGATYYENRRDAQDRMHYGIAVIDVPESHRIGGRRRLRIGWRNISWSGSSQLRQVIRLSHDDFRRALDREMLDTAPDERRMLVFVHGFKTSFPSAMRTTAQLASDLGLPGVTAAFSWPSANNVLRYGSDRREARASAAHLVDFVLDLTRRTGVSSVDLIFHSMGNYLLSNAVSALARALAAAGERLGAVILAAPDVSPREFQTIAGQRPVLSSHGTMYATRRDLALNISGAMRGASRAGTLPPVVAHRFIDTIDATLVNESFIGHAYHSGSRTVIADIFHAIQGSRPGARHGLAPRTAPTHWRIKG